jgi:Leucine-rich repeat (LRR) protein
LIERLRQLTLSPLSEEASDQMKSRERNPAFFKQGNSKGEADSGRGELSGGLANIFKNARASGKLILTGRSLTSIPDEVFMLGTSLQEGEKFWELNPLSRLDLSSNMLKHLPIGKFELLQSDLVCLKLKDNKLDSLPKDFFACNLLQHLDLSINALTELNVSVGELIQLKELLASDNKLETLPTSLGSCKNLQLLELQNNQLSRIPSESLALPQLLRLDLSSNKLTMLPSSICELKFLGKRNDTIIIVRLFVCSFVRLYV